MSNSIGTTSEETTAAPFYFRSVTYNAPNQGPAVIITGAVHGNEICGTEAIKRVIQEIESGKLHLKTGMVTFVPVTNPLAYRLGARTGERNLNRKLMPTLNPGQFEDYVANWLCPLLAQHDVLLDLHSFSGPGEPFVMVGPENNRGVIESFQYAAKEQGLALRLGVRRVVDGWLSAYASGVAKRNADALALANPVEFVAEQKTDLAREDSRPIIQQDVQAGIGVTEYMRVVGGYALTIECGQHQNPDSQAVGYQAIVNALRYLDILTGEKPDAITDVIALRLADMVSKLHDADRLCAQFANFEPVKQGQLLAIRHDGSHVCANYDGYVLFSDPNAVAGSEWFYLAKDNPRFL